MDLEASWLLGQIKADMQATSERQHRDARRQHALRSASLALGTGLSAEVVKARLGQAGLMLRPLKKGAPVLTATQAVDRFAESLMKMTDGIAKARPGYVDPS